MSMGLLAFGSFVVSFYFIVLYSIDRKRRERKITLMDNRVKAIESRLDNSKNHAKLIEDNKDSIRHLMAKIDSLEEYLDIRFEEWAISDNKFLKRSIYKDKCINQLKLLYDYLDVEVKKIDARSAQYKLIKRKNKK